MGNIKQVTLLGPVVSRKGNMSLENRKIARRLKMHWDPKEKYMIHPMIQWFIHYDNFGAVKYDDQFYNLMNVKDRNVLMVRLIVDDVISVQGVLVHDEFGNEHFNPGYFKVLDEDYLFIQCKEERFFWINMVDRVLPQMTLEECEAYNAARKIEEAHVL